jgi:hypothetical protein
MSRTLDRESITVVFDDGVEESATHSMIQAERP